MKLGLGTPATTAAGSGTGAGPLSRFKLKGRELALIALAVSALAGLLWYFYLYTPTKAQIQTLSSENQQLESDIAVGRAARASLPALRAEVARLKQQRNVFLAQLPEENEVAELLDQLRSAARDARVTFTGLTNGGPATDVVPGVRLLNFSLSTESTYERTIAFLRALEALPRFTRVQRVGVGTGATGEGSATNPSLSATYDFTVYVYTGVDAGLVADPNAVVPGTESEVQ